MKHSFKDPYLDVSSPVITKGKRTLFQNSKIVIAGMTKEIRCFHSNVPLAVGVGVFSVTESKYNLESVAAILNSLAFTFLYREKFEAKHLAGGYLAINASQLKDADFPIILSDLQIKELKSWNKKISAKSFSLNDRIDYETYVADLMGVTLKEIASLSVFDIESKEFLESIRKVKSIKKAA